MNSYKEKRKKAKEMRIDGVSIPKIAKSLGVAKSTVREWVKEIILSDAQKKSLYRQVDYDQDMAIRLFYSDKTYQEIADELKIKNSTLISLYRRKKLSRSRESYSNCQACHRENLVRNGKICSSCGSAIRRLKNKIKSVNYLGGKCFDCGLELPIDEYAAYEFHHVKDKKDQLSSLMIKNWERIEPELKKCQLLCSNCHRIVHSKGRYDMFKDYLA
jgi:rRNA maturation endonuclease Nob1